MGSSQIRTNGENSSGSEPWLLQGVVGESEIYKEFEFLVFNK